MENFEPCIKKLETIEEQRELFTNFTNFYEKTLDENKVESGVIKIIHPKEHSPVKNGLSEIDINNLNFKIGDYIVAYKR